MNHFRPVLYHENVTQCVRRPVYITRYDAVAALLQLWCML
jgi:hypothetical protein